MYTKYLILTVLFVPIALFSQTISGKIENSNGTMIPFANVVIKDSINASGIKQYVIAKNGAYSISLNKKFQKIVIEVSANKYYKEYFIIDSFLNEKPYFHNFILRKDTVVRLAEVMVKAKAPPFQINNDTVNYNVSSYRDGSEKKIQDIIKKLPGVTVDEKTGEIRYKGKSVETVKLDGDDLFGSNYSIGTKNINVDMVEQVQAIENYNDNPLLKGIESSDKVALNLKLKKKKSEYTGDIDFGTGLSQGGKAVFDASSNIIGISKKYKSFTTVSYNNIGINNAPYDYFSYNPNVEQIKESDYFAKKIIAETFFDSELGDQRSNINNSTFGSYNSTFAVGKHTKIKANLNYIKDKVLSTQLFLNENVINGQQFQTSDNYNIEKKPTQYRGDLEIKSNSSKTSLLEYKLKISTEAINTITSIIQNNTSNYNTVLKVKNLNFKHSLLFTKKINAKKAIQFLFTQSSNDVPQNYLLSPPVYEPLNYSSNNQYSNFKKNIYNFQSVLLGSSGKNKYTFTIGTKADINDFQSNLHGINNGIDTNIDIFQNNFHYRKITLYNSANYKFVLRKWRLTPSYSLTYLTQNLHIIRTHEKRAFKKIIFEPAFSFTYKLNSLSAIVGTLGYSQKPFSEEYFFDNPIYISNRIIKTNEIDLRLQKTTVLGIFYIVNNLYKQFQFNFGVNFIRNQGNYFSNIFIQENITGIKYFYLPNSNHNINLNFLVEKYITAFQGTVRLKSNYSNSNYKNIINNSDIRDNNYQAFSSELFMKTAFDFNINFENIIRYKKNKSQNASNKAFSNETFSDAFKIIMTPNKNYFLLLTTDYYLPNIKKRNENYLFLDASLISKSKQKKYEISFRVKNILNNKKFTQLEITDYSTSIFNSNLIPRYFMLSVSRNF